MQIEQQNNLQAHFKYFLIINIGEIKLYKRFLTEVKFTIMISYLLTLNV